MNAAQTFRRRIGPSPQEIGVRCVGCQSCPDIWELADGNFAIIGEDITHLANTLPPEAGCGVGERIVKIPRATLVFAKPHIPERG